MQLQYFKMHGTGNRILIVDERRQDRLPPTGDKIIELGNAGSGPGFDQLMWLSPPRCKDAVASYRVFNRDGSEVEQCGNGVRCVAWMLATLDAGGAQSLRLDSPAGPVDARIVAADRVAVNMGRPVFEPEKVPFIADKELNSYDLEVNGSLLKVQVASMGNPHCVLDVHDVGTADVGGLGPAIERHPRFPAYCNVGFRHIVDRHRLDLRVFERGAGETRACGTGACAAVVLAHRSGKVGDEVTVDLPGGQVVVSWRGAADSVWLTGNVELIDQGTIDL